jgi:hypothetical protein
VGYREIIQQGEGLSVSQIRLFCASSVLRIHPLIDACSTPHTGATVLRLSDLLWVDGYEQEKLTLVRELGSAPEAEAESAEELHYWSYHALSVAIEAAQVGFSAGDSERFESCCALMLNIMGDFDAVITLDEGQIGEEGVTPGLYEELEVKSQQAVLDALLSTASESRIEENIKAVSESARGRLAEAIPEFIRCGGWGE